LSGVDFVIAVDHAVQRKRKVIRAHSDAAGLFRSVSVIEDNDAGGELLLSLRGRSPGDSPADDVTTLFAELNIGRRFIAVGYLNFHRRVARG
jgi:hypothetical protein